MSEIYDKDRSDKAISDVCAYFRDNGLSIFECWHVCETIMLSALQLMGERARSECDEMRGMDIERLREKVVEGAHSKSS